MHPAKIGAKNVVMRTCTWSNVDNFAFGSVIAFFRSVTKTILQMAAPIHKIFFTIASFYIKKSLYRPHIQRLLTKMRYAKVASWSPEMPRKYF